jgi:putative Ca2+/H+ antiporter (TMEM165/GDT1 family)
MTRFLPTAIAIIVAPMLAVLGGRAISAQDKYTVQVPGGLAFSEVQGIRRLGSNRDQ